MLYYYMYMFLLFIGFIMLMIGLFFINYDLMIFMDWEILMVNSMSICMSIIFDYMSLIFMGCVLLISSMVIYYSVSYMKDNIYKIRFLFLVFMFVMSMMMMIISPNMISIILGWDGLGLVSYCLVIFFQNIKSYNAGMLTVMTNRIGDVFILMCVAWMLNFGGWDFIFYLGLYDNYMSLVILMVIIAGFTKSAQIPFSSWLPAAMAAPTPVSALVHSSTLVTAGVYMLIRFSYVFSYMDCGLMIYLSLMTMLMSGFGANFEYDLKKIIALSTLSQLGLMMSIMFMGYYKLAFFHLLTHAFFKALLFLCAGVMIHVMDDSQDIRSMGNIINMMPYTSSCFMVSTFSLCGMPFLSGFYSKDLIMEFVMMGDYNFIYLFMYMISIMFTMSYSFRLMMYLMYIGSGMYCYNSYYEDNIMMMSMVLLLLMSVVLGSVLSWLLLKNLNIIILPLYLKIMPLLLVMMGMLMGYMFMYYNMNMQNSTMNLLLYFFGLMWFMPNYSTYMLYNNYLYLVNKYGSLMDNGWGEFIFSKSHMKYMNKLSMYSYILELNNIKLFLISYIIMIFMLML